MKKPFSAASVAALIAEKREKEACISDLGCKGLYLRIRPGSEPVWLHIFTYDKQQHRHTLGPCRSVLLKDAREYVMRTARLIDQGHCPDSPLVTRKREAEAVRAYKALQQSFSTVFEAWHSKDIKPEHKDGGKGMREHFERHVLPKIGEMPITAINRRHLLEVLDAISDKGSERVHVIVKQNLIRVFEYAELRELVSSNPASPLRAKKTGKKKKRARTRYLAAGEVTELSQKLPESGMEETSQAALLLLIATIVRVGALYAAKWSDIDFEARVWRAWDQKKKPRVQYDVYLSDFALQQFGRIKSEQKRKEIETDWVMYSRRNPKKPVSPGSLNKQIQDRQGSNKRKKRVTNSSLALSRGHWTVHDLRRTGASHLKALGIIEEVRRACMNHESESVLAQTYDREEIPFETRTAAFIKLGEKLSSLTEDHLNVRSGVPGQIKKG